MIALTAIIRRRSDEFEVWGARVANYGDTPAYNILIVHVPTLDLACAMAREWRNAPIHDDPI